MPKSCSNTYAIGDIHGSYKALMQCLSLANFDYEQDHLIVLGDVCDGYPETRQCIDELLKIKNCHLIRGNHDQWALDWMLSGIKPEIWTRQGGEATLKSFGAISVKAETVVPEVYKNFLLTGKHYIEWQNNKSQNQLFVHGGFEPGIPIGQQDKNLLMWDRQLVRRAYDSVFLLKSSFNKKDGDTKDKDIIKFNGYDDIFVGHTTTETFYSLQPIHACNVWMLDTGAGWSGKLTIMNINTYQYWQSQPSKELYKDTIARNFMYKKTYK